MGTYEEFPGYETVLTFGDFDYSWSEMRVYRKDGRLFYLTDSGCSCYGWNDQGDLKESDMIELPTLDAARNAYGDWMRDGGEGFDGQSPITWIDVAEKLRDLGLR